MSKTYIILPDIHFGQQDDEALECVYRASRYLKPTNYLQLGDALDCGAVSSHPGVSPDETAHTVLEEASAYNKYLDRLVGKNETPFTQMMGNHEWRVSRWAASKGGALGPDVVKLLDVGRLLRCRVDVNGEPHERRKNFTIVPYAQKDLQCCYKITKDLIAVHGWGFAANAATVHMRQAAGRSIVFGHTHRMQDISSRDPITGRSIHAWTPGCLSKLTPLWQAGSPNEWLHGFSIVYVGTKSWTHYTVKIDRGYCVLPCGKEIKL